jgi:type II secretory pathway pseudopilin PulG
MKSLSKTVRWSEAASQAMEAIQTLMDMQEEYQEIMDNVPENLSGSNYYQKLEEVTNLDLQSAYDAIDEASNTDLPRGFGRD